MAAQDPRYLYLSPEFPQDIIDLPKNLASRVKNQQIVNWLATMQLSPESFGELPDVRDIRKKSCELGIAVGIISNAFPSAQKILEASGITIHGMTAVIINDSEGVNSHGSGKHKFSMIESLKNDLFCVAWVWNQWFMRLRNQFARFKFDFYTSIN